MAKTPYDENSIKGLQQRKAPQEGTVGEKVGKEKVSGKTKDFFSEERGGLPTQKAKP